MTHEYTEYTYEQEIADLSLILSLFVEKCKIIKIQDLVAHETTRGRIFKGKDPVV